MIRVLLIVLQASLIAGLAHVPSHLQADEPSGASDCTVRSSNQRVVIIVCRPGLDHEALRSAGESACAGAKGICNAWIWEDADIAPDVAPATDAGLDQDKVREAVAVWVHDSARLMVLQKQGEPRPSS